MPSTAGGRGKPRTPLRQRNPTYTEQEQSVGRRFGNFFHTDIEEVDAESIRSEILAISE